MNLDAFLAKYSTKYNQQKNSKILQQPLNENLLLPVQTINPRANIIKKNYISNKKYINNNPQQIIAQTLLTNHHSNQYKPNMLNINPDIQQFAPQPNYIQQEKSITFTTFTQPAKTTTFSHQPVYPIYTKPQTYIPVIQTTKYLKPVFKPTPLSQTYHTIPTPTTNNNQIAIKGYTQHHSNRAEKVLDLILSNKLQFSNNLSETDINNFILALCTDNKTNQIFSSLNNGAPYIYNGQPKYYPDIMSNTINNKYNFK